MAPHQPRRRMGTIAPARVQLEVVRWGGRHVKRPTTTGELRGEAACYGNRVSQRARAASDFALVCPASPAGRAYVATPHMADPFLPTRLPTHTTHTQRDTWLDLLAAAAPVRGANGFPTPGGRRFSFPIIFFGFLMVFFLFSYCFLIVFLLFS